MFDLSLNSNPVKKAVALALFVCFAIYHFGYYAFYFSYQRHIEGQWITQIYDEQLQDYSEILIEVPLSIPYMANQEDFQVTNTPYEKDGKYFRVIKQRYQNDTLQLIAVADSDRTVLKNTIQKWVSSLTDDEPSQDHQGKLVLKTFAKDYLQPEIFQFKICFSAFSNQLKAFVNFQYLSPTEETNSPPPKLA